jgi:hypothetical protein
LPNRRALGTGDNRHPQQQMFSSVTAFTSIRPS